MLAFPFLLAIVALGFASASPVSQLLYYKRDGSGVNISSLPPSQDPFYVLPDNLDSYEEGAIIRSRPIPTNVGFGDSAGSAYQLFYRTNGVNLLPDATVTTVVAPKSPASGVPKVVAIATPEDSAAFDCSVSWSVYPNSASNETSEVTSSLMTASAALYNGYYVTIPDLEGSKSTFLAYSEGQVVLDSIRAIVNHNDTIPDSTGYKAALTGYSGGGHGSAWASQLASTYGKGIPIVALAAGGVPVNLEQSMQYLDGTSQASLSFLAMAGLSNAYPDLNEYYQAIFKDNGTEAFEKVRTGAYCAPQASTLLAHANFNASTSLKYPNTGAVPRRILDENHLGLNQEPITDFPVYLVHSRADMTVPFGPAEIYYESQCSKGASILFSAVPTGSHLQTGLRSVASFFTFIKQAFEGTLQSSTCEEIPFFLVSTNSTEASDILGANLTMIVQQALEESSV